MRLASTVLFALLLSPLAFPRPAAPAQGPSIQAEAERLTGWGYVPEIVQAVQDQNAKRVSLDSIRRIDAAWIYATKESVRMRRLMSNRCAEKLKALAGLQPNYREAMVMDDQGALVCITRRTTDYWQGDEAKWQRAFNDGRGTLFIDDPKYDESVGMTLVHISVPVIDGGRTIGVVTVGLEPDGE